MPIRATCEACESSFLVKDELAGKLGRCPRCGQTFRVPGGGGEEDDPSEASDSLPAFDASGSSLDLGAGGGSGVGRASRSSSRLTPSANGKPGAPAGGDPANSNRKLLWAGASLISATLLVAVGWYVLRPAPKKQPKGPATAQQAIPLPPRGIAKIPAKPSWLDDSQRPELKKPKPGATDQEMVEYVQHAIVKIDVFATTWNAHESLGSGFVIEKSKQPDGSERILVATNYHVVASARKADVLFYPGAVRYGVEGYMAVRPEYDLAILKLNGAPKQTAALPLRFSDNPAGQSEVFAFGHPHGTQFVVERGRVTSVLKTSQLSAENQRWLGESLRPLNASGDPSEKIDHQWIMHSANIEPGNSGGPLVNTEGEVLGVNSWISRADDGTRKYAIHVKYVEEMMSQLFPSPRPLTDFRRERARQVASGRPPLKLESLQGAFTKAAATGWKPKSPDEAKLLRDVAGAWAFAQFVLATQPDDFPRVFAGEPEAWKAEMSRMLGEWQKVPWDESHVKAANSAAAPGASDGVFLFGNVAEVYEDAEKHQMLKITAIGGTQTLYVPVVTKTAAAAKGASCLVVGMVVGFQNVGDNPLKPQEVPVVIAPVMIPLELKKAAEQSNVEPPKVEQPKVEQPKVAPPTPKSNPPDAKTPAKTPAKKPLPTKELPGKTAAR